MQFIVSLAYVNASLFQNWFN